MSQILSVRLPDELASRLDRFARRRGNGMTRTRATVQLLDEALREAEFVGIEFRDTSVGRSAFVRDTGMAVWELVRVAREFALDPQRTASHLACLPARVRTALHYYEAFPAEIDHAIADNDLDETRLKRLLPQLEIVTVPASVEDSHS